MKSAQNKEETLGEAWHRPESQGVEKDACLYSNRAGGAGAGIQPCMSQQSALNLHCRSWVLSSFTLGFLLLNLKKPPFIKTGIFLHKNLSVLPNK